MQNICDSGLTSPVIVNADLITQILPTEVRNVEYSRAIE